MSIKASEYGNRKVQVAKQSKGWAIENPKPLLEASKILEPNKHWPEEPSESSFYEVAQATWRRFIEGKAIRTENFKAFCEILDLDWREISQVGEAFDIRREPQESRCEKTILQPASFLRIKGPQRMGKTRMLHRILKRVKSITPENKIDQPRIITVNFLTSFDQTVYESLDKFLKSFCQAISYKLTKSYPNLATELIEDFQKDWQQLDDAAPNYKASVYFEDRLLDSPLILVLEDIDRVFEASFALDFCDLIRGWYTEAQRDELWQNLSLVIVHATDVYATMDINSSPLANIGEVVSLEEFSLREVEDLAQQYHLDWNRACTEKVMALIGGNPDLIDLTFKTIVDYSATLDSILSVANTEASIYRDRLRKLWEIISLKPRLKTALTAIITQPNSLQIDPLILYQLESLGAIAIQDNQAKPRCELYRQYFSRVLTTTDNL